MFKSIHGIAPVYMCNEIVMNLNGYDTRGTDGKNIYLPKSKKYIDKTIFIYRGSSMELSSRCCKKFQI